jgi:hypothetical protein|tara:strand:- start:3968 stop:5149 length:1182 start_codon:yes stop_codon:yes gene_type:complete
MSFYKFTEDDLFTNTIEAYPEYSFYVVTSSIYINNVPNLSGAATSNIFGVPDGFISLYEYNIDRGAGYSIYPFLVKDGFKNTFKSYNTGSYRIAQYGTQITSSYQLSSSIKRFYYDTSATGSSRKYLFPLKNTLNYYTYLSPRYAYSGSFGNKDEEIVNLIDVPSIFYGSSIKKGSVSLKLYVSGALIAELQDKNYNGDLIQVSGSTYAQAQGSGKVAGSVLYNEGFIVLTGSWDLDGTLIDYLGTGTGVKSKWIYFAAGANDSLGATNVGFGSASFAIDYKGTTHTQTMTMFAHARAGELNYSNNPTYLKYNEPNYKNASTGSSVYGERPVGINNNVNSDFTDVEPDFQKITYISKVGLYDENKNLIGVAKVATPVRKTPKSNYTFKLKLDI